MSFARRFRAALTLLIAALVAATVSAPAQQGAAPAPACGVQITDPKGDHNATTGDNDAEDFNLDIITGWFAYDASKGDKAVTANLVLADMSDRTPAASTGAAWNFVYSDGPDSNRFVRRLLDFSGEYYEYGTFMPISDTNPLARYQYEGTTEGQAFEGPNGVISIVVPKAAGAELGKELKTPFATASASKQALPGAVPSPTRGLSTAIDTAPDNGEPGVGGKVWKVGPCPADGSIPTGSTKPPPSVPTAPPSGEPQPQPQPQPQPATQEQSSGPLPVKVLTKKAKKLKKGRTLVVKLSAAEPVTKLAAQLRKGSKVVATGKLAKLSGKGKLKLKLKSKLGKGRYVLDLAGSDARGAHRITQAKLTVR